MIKANHAILAGIVLAALLIFSQHAAAQATDDSNALFPEATTDEWMSASYAMSHHEGSAPFALVDYLYAFGGDEAAIVNHLGQPLQRYSKDMPNRHISGAVNTFVTLVYDGLTIEILKAPNRTFIHKLYIENCGLNSPFQRYLCQPVNQVKTQLGEPNVTTPNELIYTLYFGDIGQAPLRLGIEDGKISWIYVRSYID